MPNRSNVDAPVALLGAPRSGTTLVSEFFRPHPEFDGPPIGETANLIFGAWHAIDLARGVTRPTIRQQQILSADERAALAVRDVLLSLFPDRSPRWIHKPIGLPKAVSEQFGDDEWDEAAEWYWRVWTSTFPNASTAIILRNPWDVVASQRTRFGFSEESLWWSYTYLTHILAHPNRRTNHVVRYEDLVRDPEAETRRLFGALGVEFDPVVMKAFDRQHVPNDRKPQRHELKGPTPDQRELIDAAFASLEQPLEWVMEPRATRTPTSAPGAGSPDLQAEVDRLERKAERRELDAADERFRLHQEAARWRRIVEMNRHRLVLDNELAAELDRQVGEGVRAQATEAERETYIRALEAELDRVYGSKTWRAATHFFHARNQYRHHGRTDGLKAFFAPPVVRARVQDFRDRKLPKPAPPVQVPRDRERGIGLVLPSGITLGGVTSWAIEMAGDLSERRRSVVIQHPDTGPPIDTEVGSRVEVFAATSPAVPRPQGVERLAHEYAAALPGVFVPNYNYAGYAMLAHLSSEHADRIRIVGMAHTDQLHYYSLLGFYEPIIATFVAVSSEIAIKLRRLLPTERHDDIVVMPYGVQIPELDTRVDRPDGEPLRLVYAGRLEAEQKRVTRLAALAARLHAANVNFTLDIVGDGDEEGPLRSALARLPQSAQQRVSIRGSVRPDEMSALWQSHDVCILVSAYEGTSIAMLEAMANGCVPVVTSVSGTRAVISDPSVGITCDRDDLDHMVRELKGLEADRERLRAISQAARQKVAAEYSFVEHAQAFEDLCLATWQNPARIWPADRPVVPADRTAFEAGVERRVER